jgi:putative NADPH-quinone reductase
LRVLVVFAHPLETSFVAALHRRIVETLAARGHQVDDLDLYAEGFDPVMSRQTFVDYLSVPANRTQARPYVERLLAAEALVLVSPVWHDGFPAILKGFFDCVFLRGVVFEIDEGGAFRPILSNIKRVAAICAFGSSRQRTSLLGQPTRRFVKHNLGALIAPGSPCDHIALYEMDAATPQRRAQHLRRVTRAFEAW